MLCLFNLQYRRSVVHHFIATPTRYTTHLYADNSSSKYGGYQQSHVSSLGYNLDYTNTRFPQFSACAPRVCQSVDFEAGHGHILNHSGISFLGALKADFECRRVEDEAHKEAKPYIWRGPPLAELPISNAKFEEKPLNLTDVRTLAEEDKPKVDTHGFCFVSNKSKFVSDIHNDDDAAPYVGEMADYLKNFLGVETVIGFNARVRWILRRDIGVEYSETHSFYHLDSKYKPRPQGHAG